MEERGGGLYQAFNFRLDNDEMTLYLFLYAHYVPLKQFTTRRKFQSSPTNDNNSTKNSQDLVTGIFFFARYISAQMQYCTGGFNDNHSEGCNEKKDGQVLTQRKKERKKNMSLKVVCSNGIATCLSPRALII